MMLRFFLILLLGLGNAGCSSTVSQQDFFTTLTEEAKATQPGFPKSFATVKRQTDLARAKDKDGNTAFLYAAGWVEEGQYGQSQMKTDNNPQRLAFLELLLQSGADVAAVDSRGRTALHRAAPCPNLVKALLDSGSDVNAQDKLGETPLDVAGNPESVQLLTSKVATR